MSTTIILSNLVFSIGGFILGYVVARIGRQVEEVSEVIVDGEKHVPLKPRKRRFTWRQILGLVVLMLAIASTITSAIASSEQRRSAEQLQRVTACQAEFNKAYRLALSERADAANRERESLREMWGALLDPAATTDSRRAAAVRYYETLDKGDQTRAQNPLPSTDRCD